MSYIECENLALGYEGKAVVSGLNFKVNKGDYLCVLGENGAGKSTFSRCFCGLEKQCGTIIWNGKTYRPKERLKACYMVMQEVNHQLFTETIQDEVMISMKEENEKMAY